MAPCSGVWAPTALSYFTMVMSAILGVITVGGNLLVCIAVIKDPHRKLRSPFMFILVNLAIVDMVAGGITLPTSVTTHYLEAARTKKKFHVIIIHMTYFISCTASILNLSALCIDRYMAVAWPVKYRRLLSLKVCIAVSVAIWVLATSISMIYWATGYINYLFIYAHTAVIVALIIAFITYRIHRKLLTSRKKSFHSSTRAHQLEIEDDQKEASPVLSKAAKKAERHVTRAFLMILIMFIACYTPAIIMMYILKFCPDCDCTFRHVLRDLNFLFIMSNSAVNPFVCTIRLKPFRQALRTIFKQDVKKGESTSTSEDTMSAEKRQLTVSADDSTRKVSNSSTGSNGQYQVNAV